MQFFNNLTLFRFPSSLRDALEGLDAHLPIAALKPLGALEMSTRGFVSPFGRGDDALSHRVGDCILLALGGEDKLLPAAVVNEALAKKLDAARERDGRNPGGRERKRMKDEVLTDLLPRAFARPSRLDGSSGSLRSAELWSACARAGVSKQSAKRAIAQLIATGEVRVQGKTRSAVYSMPTAGGSPPVGAGAAARVPPTPAVQQPREREITDLLMDLVQTERRATAAMVRAASTSSDPVMRTLASALVAIRTAADVADLGRMEGSA